MFTQFLHDWRERLWLLARPRAPEDLPAAIDRRRIYILPTRFGAFIGLLLFAMLLGALNYNNNPALLLSFLFAAAVHNSFIRAHLNLSGVRLLAVGTEPVHAGGQAALRCLLEADARRARPGLELTVGPARATANLAPGQRQAFDLALPAPRRGWLAPGRLRLTTRQPHGLARAWCWFWPQTRILVYPALEALAPPLPYGSGERGQRLRRGHGEEVHHLRDYRVGDPLRQVAWKASARHAQLLVREYEAPRGADIVLDWNRLPGLAREPRIRRLARWVVEAERQGLRYALVLPGQRLGPDLGPAHRHACLQALALLPDD